MQKVYDHANHVLDVLIVKSKAAGGLPMQVFSHLFNSLVLSRLDYCAAMWANGDFSFLDQKFNIMHCGISLV